MKGNNCMVIVAAFVILLLLTAGCKSKRLAAENVFTERVVLQRDSSAFWELRDSLQVVVSKLDILEGELKKSRVQNIDMRNETLEYKVDYDTNSPVDSITNRSAVQSELFTVTSSRIGNIISESEILHLESRKEIEMLTLQNSNLKLSVMSLQDENRELKEVFSSGDDYSRRYSIAAAIAGIVIVLLGGLSLGFNLFR